MSSISSSPNLGPVSRAQAPEIKGSLSEGFTVQHGGRTYKILTFQLGNTTYSATSPAGKKILSQMAEASKMGGALLLPQQFKVIAYEDVSPKIKGALGRVLGEAPKRSGAESREQFNETRRQVPKLCQQLKNAVTRSPEEQLEALRNVKAEIKTVLGLMASLKRDAYGNPIKSPTFMKCMDMLKQLKEAVSTFSRKAGGGGESLEATKHLIENRREEKTIMLSQSNFYRYMTGLLVKAYASEGKDKQGILKEFEKILKQQEQGWIKLQNESSDSPEKAACLQLYKELRGF